MSAPVREIDLVCLVADGNMKQTLLGLLGRQEAMGIRPIRFELPVHLERDPGCFLRSPEFLQPFVRRAGHALVIFDREGCGQESLAREKLEAHLEERLHAAGWGERAAAIAIDPELESWVWSDSPHVATILGWEGKAAELRILLEKSGYLAEGHIKPLRPKEAVEKALRVARRPRSSSIYGQLAARVSFGRCIDPAFGKLGATLRRWFPSAQG